MFKYVLLAVLVAVAAWAVGVRIHPEAIPDYFHPPADRNFREIVLKSGQSFVGEVVEDLGQSVLIEIEGGSMTFSKGQIAQMNRIEPEDLEKISVTDKIVKKIRQPLLTCDPKKNIFLQSQTAKPGSSAPGASPAAAPMTAGSPLAAAPGKEMQDFMSTAISQAYQAKAMADMKQREIQRQIAEMEGEMPAASKENSGGSYRFSLKNFDESK